MYDRTGSVSLNAAKYVADIAVLTKQFISRFLHFRKHESSASIFRVKCTYLTV
jgi:hypothetical protein